MDINLEALDLESKWPKLARLQDEIRDLEKHARSAEVEVSTRRAAIQPAREQDLDAAAKAVRSGGKSPKTSNEDEAKGRLHVAERNHAVMSRALEAARTDMGVLLQQHRAALFADVAECRAQIAREAATAAREALVAYSRYEDLHYTLKALQPPPQPVDSNAPPQRLTQTIIGVATTQGGPARGDVEEALRHLVSLGSGPSQGGEDAA